MKNSLLLFTVLLTGMSVFAQRTITGKVTDDKGNPIPNVSVLVSGTTIGATTKPDGTYSLAVPANGKVLVFSSVGMDPVDVSIGSLSVVNTILKGENKILSEVLVVGYGTRKKSEFTGSAATLSNKDFAQRPVTNVVNALAGSAPGIQTSASGQPGDPIAIRIRGYGSISAGNGPLIIVDGSTYEGNISSINPRDVESLTTLKDAATTALYGSRASNGVIMITTKNGNARKPTLGFQASRGFVSRLVSEYERTNPFEYYPLMWEAMKNSRISGSSASTPAVAAQYATDNIAGASGLKYNPFNVPGNQIVDINGKINPNAQLLWGDDLDWAKEISQTGNREEYGVTYSGGSDKSDFFGSVGYTNEQGYTIDAFLKKYSGRVNINTKPTNWIKTGINLAYTYSNSSSSNDGSNTGFVNPFFFARTIAPIYPVYAHNTTTGEYLLDALGSKIYDYGSAMVSGNRPTAAYGGRHVVAETKWNKNKSDGSLLSGRTYVDFTPIKDLILSIKLGGDINTGNTFVYQNNLVGDGAPSGILDKSQFQRRTYTLNEVINYNKKFKAHHVSALLGHENYDYYLLTSAQEKQGQSFPDVYEFDNFVTFNSITSATDRRRIESYFSGLNYDFNSKYLLSLSFRRDGNSRFSSQKRWATFYGAGLGWVLSNENFIKKISWINSLKLRSTYGSVGNDNIGTNYGYQAVYQLGYTNGGSEAGALLQNARPNNDLTWEEAKTFDAGVEFSLFKNRIYGSVEWYHRNSDKVIFNFQFPPSAGGNINGGFSELRNIGSMRNTGLEVDLHADIIKSRDFRWNVGLNASTLKNTITKMPADNPTILNGTKQFQIGHSIYDYWLREWMGVDETNGNALYRANSTTLSATTFVNNKGDIVTTDINNAKKYYAGTAIPDLYGGFNTSFRYKNFEFLVRFKYQLGGKTYDGAYSALNGAGNYGVALHKDILNRWQKSGDITNVPKLDFNKLTDYGAATSTRWLADGSFLNFENVTFSFDLSELILSKIHASSAKFFVSADNVGYLVARKGMNPNQGFSGVTSNVYTPARIITTGLNINF
jgi:TonB-linked SusC/RagA family outer membrane protein